MRLWAGVAVVASASVSTLCGANLNGGGSAGRGMPQAAQPWYINIFPYLGRPGWLVCWQTGPPGAMVDGTSLFPTLGGFKTAFFVHILLNSIASPHPAGAQFCSAHEKSVDDEQRRAEARCDEARGCAWAEQRYEHIDECRRGLVTGWLAGW